MTRRRPSGRARLFNLVKASLMRITLHAVHAEDYPDFHHAMLPALRASRLGDTRFTASAADFAQFTMLRRTVALQALRTLTDEVEELKGPDGVTLFDVPGAPIPAEDTVAPPRLLPMWDSVLLAYADRSRVIPPEYRPLVIRRNGDVLPTLLVDGYVAGVWRPVEGGIEASAFHLLDDRTWQGLASEAGALTAFLADRDPAVYRRYAHWWAKPMPSAETRLLPG